MEFEYPQELGMFKNEERKIQEYQELATLPIQQQYAFYPGKDRFTDVLPYESTRVKLRVPDGVPNYINASYISFEGQVSYIAAQAPLETTVQDFWTMLWDEQTPVVVNLTKDKCSTYWPKEGKIAFYGNLAVYHKKSWVLGGEIIVRHLFVRKLVADFVRDQNDQPKLEVREIMNLQYIGWPDHGVPSSTAPTKMLLRLATQLKARASSLLVSLDGPILVHCTAGIGRTGTFITAHMCQQKIDSDNDYDIKAIVHDLRKQRIGMVSNVAQYQFIYEIVQELENDHQTNHVPSNKEEKFVL